MEIASDTIQGLRATPHDYHVILLDVNEIDKAWKLIKEYDHHVFYAYLKNLATSLREQIETGGVTFCFLSPQESAIRR